MRRALAHALLVAGLALAAPASAQVPGTASPAAQADAHVFSAFTTRTDPRVLAEKVTLGPALREQLGDETDHQKIYEALVAAVAGKPLTSRTLSAGEAVGHASLGVNAAEPLVLLEAGDVRLLMQYSSAEKNVAFVEQLAGALIAAPQAAKPEPIVEKALPTEPPPAEVAAPAPAVAAPAPTVEVPTPAVAAPAAAAVPKPKPQAAKPAPKARASVAAVAPAVAKPAAAPKPAVVPQRAEKPRPRGDCVIKPVMSEDDLWNCSAPGLASSPQIDTPAPAVTATSAFASQSTLQAPPQPTDCVIRPVMSEADMRACAAASRSRPSTPVEVAAPVAAAAAPIAAVKPASAPPASAPPSPAAVEPAPPSECVIKPVMTDAEMKACAAASRSRPAPAPVEPPAPAVAAATYSAPTLQVPTQPRECVIKPVMSEEDLRACAAVSRAAAAAPAETIAAPAPAKPAAATPAPAPEPRECVIKPVMSEEDLRACSAR